MICRNCNAEIQDYSQVCPYCGFNFTQQQNVQQNFSGQNNMYNNQNTNFSQYQTQYAQQPKKKGKGCLIVFIIFLIVGALGLGGLVLGGTLLFGAAKSSFDVSEDGIRVRIGTEGFDGNFEELDEELDEFMEELDSMSKDEYSGEDIDENYVEENNKDLFKDSDGDGVLDTDIFND